MILQNTEGTSSEARPRDLEERWILARIDATRAEVDDAWARYEFAASTDALYHLTFDDFCDWYAEAIKPRLYEDDPDAAATALAALERLLALLHPVHAARDGGDLVAAPRSRGAPHRLSVARAPDPRYADAASALERVQEAAQIFRRSGVEVELGSDDERRIFAAVVRPERAKVDGNRDAEVERLRKEVARAEGMLANERFVQNAPAEVVAAEREKLERYRRELAALERLSLRSRRCPASSGSTRSTPWPRDGFGLERMRALLAELGDPQLAFPAIHVVGTNGKSTATITIEQLLLSEGLSVGSTISPHVAGWSERIRVDGEEADFEDAVARVRPAAERLDATQFEIVTAAALAAFAAANVDVAVVEAGLGGRLDATNVLQTRVVLLTNVGLEHTDVLGDTARGDRAARSSRSRRRTASSCFPTRRSRSSSPPARSGSEARARPPRPSSDTRSPRTPRSRFPAGSSAAATRRSGTARTIPTVCATSSSGVPPGDYTIVVSILADKNADEMLRELRRVGSRLVATQVVVRPCAAGRPRSPSSRGRISTSVEAVDDPREALARAHELGEPVLVTGSLYLLGDLAAGESQ